jgi:hypothetical protein
MLRIQYSHTLPAAGVTFLRNTAAGPYRKFRVRKTMTAVNIHQRQTALPVPSQNKYPIIRVKTIYCVFRHHIN